MPFIAERPDIQFEAFQFDAFFIRDVIQYQRGEVRLACLGAQAGELGDFHVDVVIPLRIGVGKGFQCFAGLGGHLVCLLGSVRIAEIISLRAAVLLIFNNCESP